MEVISVLVSMLGFLIGILLFLKPSQAIEMQRKFYEKINWRMEPVSMQKEIRNTKMMGMLLFVFALLALIFLFVRKHA